MNQQGPPPKVEPLNIKKIILEIKKNEDLNTKDKKIKHLKKYRYMKTDYEFLYNLIINNDLNDDTIKEVKILNQMLEKIEDIKDKKVSKKKGEEDIGKVLVDEYVMPMLDKNKDKTE